MKIGKKPGGIDAGRLVGKSGNKGPAAKPGASGKASGSDSVNISPKARELNRVKTMLDSTPDVRGEMVVKLKTEIENGDYNVDAGKVAEKMIERALRNIINSGK